MASNASLSNAQARRLALGAQGFNDPRPAGRVDRRHLRRVVDRMGLIQIDSVNVLVRSQELPLFARLGPHPRSLIDDATRHGDLFEFWVHEACHVPIELYPLQRWAMTRPLEMEVAAELGGGQPVVGGERARQGAIRRPDRRQRPGDARAAEGHLVGLGRRQARARAPVPDR